MFESIHIVEYLWLDTTRTCLANMNYHPYTKPSKKVIDNYSAKVSWDFDIIQILLLMKWKYRQDRPRFNSFPKWMRTFCIVEYINGLSVFYLLRTDKKGKRYSLVEYSVIFFQNSFILSHEKLCKNTWLLL